MPHKPALLPPEKEHKLLAFIRAGGFRGVAAEAVGVPRERFDEWLAKGQASTGGKYRRLYLAVMQAQAEARLGAELTALKEKPMDWLKSGPGRETAQAPGWTTPARPRPTNEDKELDLLAHPQLQQLLAELLEALKPFPDARAVASELFAREPRASATGVEPP